MLLARQWELGSFNWTVDFNPCILSGAGSSPKGVKTVFWGVKKIMLIFLQSTDMHTVQEQIDSLSVVLKFHRRGVSRERKHLKRPRGGGHNGGRVEAALVKQWSWVQSWALYLLVPPTCYLLLLSQHPSEVPML